VKAPLGIWLVTVPVIVTLGCLTVVLVRYSINPDCGHTCLTPWQLGTGLPLLSSALVGLASAVGVHRRNANARIGVLLSIATLAIWTYVPHIQWLQELESYPERMRTLEFWSDVMTRLLAFGLLSAVAAYCLYGRPARGYFNHEHESHPAA
jgi:hypothetical protein